MKEVAPEARRRDATLSFAFVYPSKTGRLVVREVSSTFYWIMFVFLSEMYSQTLAGESFFCQKEIVRYCTLVITDTWFSDFTPFLFFFFVCVNPFQFPSS